MAQDIDEILKKYNEDVKRHMDVLKEDFSSQVKAIGEQYDSIMAKLNSHDARFMAIEKNIEIMKVDISFIKTSLKQKADLEEFQALEKRVAILEATSR